MSDTPKTDKMREVDAIIAEKLGYSMTRDLLTTCTEVAELRARIEELTEWRPMETIPSDADILVLESEDSEEYEDSPVACVWSKMIKPTHDYQGWLPLPQPEEGGEG